MRTAIDVRLGGHFDSVHRHAAEHFGGRHLYMKVVENNCSSLCALLVNSGG